MGSGLGITTMKLVALIATSAPAFLPSSLGSDILLVTSSMASPSHYMVLSTITGGLVSRRHNVSVIAGDVKGTTGFPNATFSQILYFKVSHQSEGNTDLMDQMTENMAFSTLGFLDTMRQFSDIMTKIQTDCIDLLKDKRLIEKLKISNFDLALVFPFSVCDILVAHYLDIPFVVVVPSVRLPQFHEGFIGMPYPSSYVPFDIFSTLTDEMTFFERLQNFASPFIWHWMQSVGNSYFYDIQLEFDIHPDKSIKDLYSHALLGLFHVNFANDFPRPYTPNWIPIGGLVSRPSKPLPQELEGFVQGSRDHGVILFTLGSAVKSLPNDIAEIFGSVFSKLPQRVLWRHNDKPPPGLGNNTKLLKWLPQNDLLGHPKTRLLIYHGGSNGVLESVSHGVPMVIIPLFADQFTHGAKIQKKGMGIMLDKTNISEQSLMAVIQEVLHNPKYKERVQHFSDIHHDSPVTPLERAVYWIEHVMKFGGEHLRPRSADMSFIELYMIDVTVFLIVVFSVGLYIDYLILRRCVTFLCGSKSPKSKPD